MTTGRRAFTLVELLTAMAAYALLVLVAGITVVALSRDLSRSRLDLEAQRDLAVSRRRMEHVVRPATRAGLAVSAGRLDVLTASGTVTFLAQGSNLVQRNAAGESSILVGGRLVDFGASLSNFAVTVTLAVRGDAITSRVTESIAYRNVP
jgi:prepilin-type N-terminal cleavage/methylation domain-containing protein